MKNLLIISSILLLFSCSKDGDLNQVIKKGEIPLETRTANNRRVYQCGPHQYPLLFGYGSSESVPPYLCKCYCDTPPGDCLDDVTISASKLSQINTLKGYIASNNSSGVNAILSSDRTYYNNLLGRSSIVDSIINNYYNLRYAESDSTGLTIFKVVGNSGIVIASPCVL